MIPEVKANTPFKLSQLTPGHIVTQIIELMSASDCTTTQHEGSTQLGLHVLCNETIRV